MHLIKYLIILSYICLDACFAIFVPSYLTLGAVAESVNHWSHVQEISCVPTHGRIKPMTYQIDTCYFLASCSALLG